MSSSLHKRLSDAPSKLLQAVSHNPADLSAFDQYWSSLASEFEEAFQCAEVDDDDIEAARVAASQIQIISEYLAAFDDDSQELTSALETDIVRELAKLSLEDVSADYTNASHPPPRVSEEITLIAPTPPYIPSAYSWITSHFHNPYPPRTCKMRLSASSGYSMLVIDDWFETVRRLIGWDDILHTHFAGSRSSIVDAARRIFVYSDVAGRVNEDARIALQNAFSRLQELYASDFAASVDIDDIPVLQRPNTPTEDQTSEEAYPRIYTVSPSPAPSLTFSSSDESESDDGSVVLPLPIEELSVPKQSRHHSGESSSRSKRRRISTSDISVEPDGFENPSGNGHEISPYDLVEDWWTAQANTDFATTTHCGSHAVVPQSRKRRLSDGDARRPPKRPRAVLPRRHMQAVSSPLPPLPQSTADDCNTWFTTCFDAPPVASLSGTVQSGMYAVPATFLPQVEAPCSTIDSFVDQLLEHCTGSPTPDDASSTYSLQNVWMAPSDAAVTCDLTTCSPLSPLGFTRRDPTSIHIPDGLSPIETISEFPPFLCSDDELSNSHSLEQFISPEIVEPTSEVSAGTVTLDDFIEWERLVRKCDTPRTPECTSTDNQFVELDSFHDWDSRRLII